MSFPVGGIPAKVRFFNSAWAPIFDRATRLRSWLSLSLGNPEQAGIFANDIIGCRLLPSLCPDGGTFIDVGAQYGAVFSEIKRSVRGVKVIAFEADSEKAEALAQVHPDATVIGRAVGEKPGILTFYINDAASGYNTLVPNDNPDLRKVEVDVVRIDDVVDAQRVHLIKIDVEGAELGVLRGAEKIISRDRPVIYFECVSPVENALGYSASKIWDWFEAQDYNVVAPNRMAHNANAMSRASFTEAQVYPFCSHNYFAVPREKSDDARNLCRRRLGIFAHP